jgi:hypothetical protein
MCLSAEADLVAGVVVGVVAVDGLRHVRRRAELPLASIPLALAGHQLVESLVWLGLEGNMDASVWRPAMYAYLVIAFGLLPVLVPAAVGALEPPATRRRMEWFTVVGIVVSFWLMYAVVKGPVVATIQDRHIDYFVDLWRGGVVVALYVVAVCGSLLVSRHRHVRWFGAANLVAAAVLAWLSESSFISLWCVWAAITSVAIVVHLRQAGGTSAGRSEALDPDAVGGESAGDEQIGGGVGEPGRSAHVRRHIR